MKSEDDPLDRHEDSSAGAGHEGPEFDRPANFALTAAWLRAQLSTQGAGVSPVCDQG